MQMGRHESCPDFRVERRKHTRDWTADAGHPGQLAEFERERIRERIHAGIARVRREGKRLGRRPHRVTDDDLTRTAHLSQHEAAKVLGVPRSVLQRARAARSADSRLSSVHCQ
jgi:hypothetical protein